ncbi:PREDICTED: mediator of RNA polymerase II transcription subunit 6-like [Nanorana parkeri]|uniref:mediator of RNA polymerase II transcription subunit 6-like n=1 Tax=Nanorana parkeri TaxID=125878 RepID=UPI000854170C|nr:PREDICTED: mediator of RNA polymerase II transcription subunit 6-like [Nanorana parkeri]
MPTIRSRYVTYLLVLPGSPTVLGASTRSRSEIYGCPDKAKPKAKKKEEASSFFQRQRVDALLLELRQKFPPKFVQQKPGEKPIPVDQIKKEQEPPAEVVVKQEEKEPVKPSHGATPKGPPEKRMRLQ